MSKPRTTGRRIALPRLSSGAKSGLKVMRAGLSGAIAMSVLFTGAWTAALLPPSPTERFVELFTSAAPGSAGALEEGILMAALIGFFGAAIVVLAYRAIAVLERL